MFYVVSCYILSLNAITILKNSFLTLEEYQIIFTNFCIISVSKILKHDILKL